jgi:hypothetical protein
MRHAAATVRATLTPIRPECTIAAQGLEAEDRHGAAVQKLYGRRTVCTCPRDGVVAIGDRLSSKPFAS